jgi:hypothetical protein
MADLALLQKLQSILDLLEEATRIVLLQCSGLIDPLLQRVIATVLEHDNTSMLVRLRSTAAQRSWTHAQMSVMHR